MGLGHLGFQLNLGSTTGTAVCRGALFALPGARLTSSHSQVFWGSISKLVSARSMHSLRRFAGGPPIVSTRLSLRSGLDRGESGHLA